MLARLSWRLDEIFVPNSRLHLQCRRSALSQKAFRGSFRRGGSEIDIGVKADYYTLTTLEQLMKLTELSQRSILDITLVGKLIIGRKALAR